MWLLRSNKTAGAGWEDVEINDEPKPVTVNMLSTKVDGKLFAAGRVYVTLFGTEIKCVALKAGEEKYVLPPENGVAWLVERGLDQETAMRLVQDAMNQPEAASPRPEGACPTNRSKHSAARHRVKGQSGLTGRKKVWLKAEDGWSPPTQDADKAHSYHEVGYGEVHWDPRRGSWWHWQSYAKVISRKFLGNFGAEHDSFFCNKDCAYRWAVAHLKKNEA